MLYNYVEKIYLYKYNSNIYKLKEKKKRIDLIILNL